MKIFLYHRFAVCRRIISRFLLSCSVIPSASLSFFFFCLSSVNKLLTRRGRWGEMGLCEAALESQTNRLFRRIDLGMRYAPVHPYPRDIKRCSGCISMSFFCDTLMPTNVWRPHLVGSALSCSCSTGDPVWLGSFHPALSLSPPPSSCSVPPVTYSRSLWLITWQVFRPFTIKKANTCCVRLLWCHMRLFWGGFQSSAVLQYAGENFPEGFVK